MKTQFLIDKDQADTLKDIVKNSFEKEISIEFVDCENQPKYYWAVVMYDHGSSLFRLGQYFMVSIMGKSQNKIQ